MHYVLTSLGRLSLFWIIVDIAGWLKIYSPYKPTESHRIDWNSYTAPNPIFLSHPQEARTTD